MCFHREMGLTIHFIVQSIRFSLSENLNLNFKFSLSFVSTYLIFLLRTHALEQCRRFIGLYSEKILLKELSVKTIRGNESGKCSGHFCA